MAVELKKKPTIVKAGAGAEEPVEAEVVTPDVADATTSDEVEPAPLEDGEVTDLVVTTKPKTLVDYIGEDYREPTDTEIAAIEAVLVNGDWGKLRTARDRLWMMQKVCRENRVSIWKNPYVLGEIQGKKKLFATKALHQERREQSGMTVRVLDQCYDMDLQIYLVHVIGQLPNGRVDEDFGGAAVNPRMKGADLIDAMCTALTRAKNRLTESMCGGSGGGANLSLEDASTMSAGARTSESVRGQLVGQENSFDIRILKPATFNKKGSLGPVLGAAGTLAQTGAVVVPVPGATAAPRPTNEDVVGVQAGQGAAVAPGALQDVELPSPDAAETPKSTAPKLRPGGLVKAGAPSMSTVSATRTPMAQGASALPKPRTPAASPVKARGEG